MNDTRAATRWGHLLHGMQGHGMRGSLALAVFFTGHTHARAQQNTAAPAPSQQSQQMEQEVERLATAVTRAETQLQASQQQIEALRQQVADLQARLAGKNATTTATESQPTPEEQEHASADATARLQAQVEVLRERQDLQQSELATHEQAKVESGSKYPVKLTGLILMNAFANTGSVDEEQSPTLAKSGTGTTGISIRQTVLGVDARGPHIYGASTHADLRVDFFGGLSKVNYTPDNGTLRLRTAHAEMDWTYLQAFFSLDRPIISPDYPTSLTAIAQPALSWSGNLWNWIPQVGAAYRLKLNSQSSVKLTGAFADVPDPWNPNANANSNTPASPSLGERSRWPGSEAHVSYERGTEDKGLRLGAGGYFSPHEGPNYVHFDAWAATLDYRIPITRWFEASGSAYRGLALGGLGGGVYKDYVYSITPSGVEFERPLDDVGGWAQLKARASERLEFNAAYGLDNGFASEMRAYTDASSEMYQALARNATFFTNVIFSPTAYTLFSFEYRKLDSTPAIGSHSTVDVYGLAAGYKF